MQINDDLQLLLLGFPYQIINNKENIIMKNAVKNAEHFNIILLGTKAKKQNINSKTFVIEYNISELISSQNKINFLKISFTKNKTLYDFELQLYNQTYQAIFEELCKIAVYVYEQNNPLKLENIENIINNQQTTTENVFTIREFMNNIKDYYQAFSYHIIKQYDNGIYISKINNTYLFKWLDYTIKFTDKSTDTNSQILLKGKDYNQYHKITITYNQDSTFKIVSNPNDLDTINMLNNRIQPVIKSIKVILAKKRIRK